MEIKSAFKQDSQGLYWTRMSPKGIVDFIHNWAAWLALVDDTIAESVWEASAGIEMSAPSNTDTTATIWLKAPGSVIGDEFDLFNTITTAGGRKETWSFRLKIRRN